MVLCRVTGRSDWTLHVDCSTRVRKVQRGDGPEGEVVGTKGQPLKLDTTRPFLPFNPLLPIAETRSPVITVREARHTAEREVDRDVLEILQESVVNEPQVPSTFTPVLGRVLCTRFFSKDQTFSCKTT